MNLIRIGLIGAAGKMGNIRRKLFSQNEFCKITQLCDTPPFTDANIAYTTNPDDIVDNPEIDAVCICTPNYLIRDLVVKALDHGKHVFAEKPPGTSLKQVQDMKMALKRNPGLVLKFGFNHRYHDAIIEAKKRIETGDYGNILWVRGRYGKSVDQSFKTQWRAKKEFAGGGILMDQGIHMLDLFVHFCGNFEEAKSFCSDKYWKLGIEDNVFAMFRNKKGQTASLHSTMTQWRHLFSLEIFLERGYMVINGILSSSGSYMHNGGEELTIALNRSPAPAAKHTQEERLNFKEDRSFKREVDEFINCVKNGHNPKYGTIDDAETIMRLIEKVYQNDEKEEFNHKGQQ
jgi:1,5-anhydro-D-fructose reductase (1,5-anhydro-D-mannitol-forming)